MQVECSQPDGNFGPLGRPPAMSAATSVSERVWPDRKRREAAGMARSVHAMPCQHAEAAGKASGTEARISPGAAND